MENDIEKKEGGDLEKKVKIFVQLSKKNHMMLQNGEVVYKRVTVPSLNNNLLQIVTDRLSEVSVSDEVLDSHLEKLHKENTNFIVSPILLQQRTVDMIMLENYCWTVELTDFKVFILSEKSYIAYKKQGMDALTLLDDNVTIPIEEFLNRDNKNV